VSRDHGSDASRLRASVLAGAGNPADPPQSLLETIAVQMVCDYGFRALKGHRLAHGWTVDAAVTAFHAMCADSRLGTRGLTARSWLEWEAGEHPNADYQDLLCRLFRTDPVNLGFRAAYKEPAAGPHPGHAADGRLERETEEAVRRAARESLAHVAAAELSDAGPALLDLFAADVTRLARAYLHEAPLPVFAELVRIRRDVCELLERRLRPSQRVHMLVLAGQACGLLANASLDLGSSEAAAAQARAAWTYALASGHDGLSAWIRGLQAMIAYWSQDRATAVTLARDGQRYASSATARTRLYAIEALACAAIGAQPEALAALEAAERAQHCGQNIDEIHDMIGGEFGFAPAKRSYLAGSTYVRLGLPRQAIASAGTAIRLYQDGPIAERSYGNEALARADLVNAYVLADNLEAAGQAAAVIFGLPHDQRIDGLSRRLRGIGRLLRDPRYRAAPQGMELIERIDAFHTAHDRLLSAAGWAGRREC
jgi:hypothetical protein